VVYVNVSPRLVRKYLLPTEKIVISVRMHPIAVISPVIVILAGAVAAGFVTGIAARSGSAGVAGVIWVLWGVLAVWQGWKVATWWRRYFVVTENRLMLITSLVDTDVGMMPLAKVTDMRLHQSTFGQALGYADFIVESAGQDQALSRINFVPYPSQMYQEILALIFSPRRSGGNGGDLRLDRLRGIAGLPVGVVPATARARRVTGDELSSLWLWLRALSRGRGACGAGTPVGEPQATSCQAGVMPSAGHRPRCHRSRSILPVEDSGDVLGVQAVEMQVQLSAGGGKCGRTSPRLCERLGGPRHSRSGGDRLPEGSLARAASACERCRRM
jgi:hypothetical protein